MEAGADARIVNDEGDTPADISHATFGMAGNEVYEYLKKVEKEQEQADIAAGLFKRAQISSREDDEEEEGDENEEEDVVDEIDEDDF